LVRVRWCSSMLNIAFDGILTFQQFGIFARREATLRLADPRIALEIAGEGTLAAKLAMLGTHPRLQFLGFAVNHGAQSSAPAPG
jgi:hypothetical protein